MDKKNGAERRLGLNPLGQAALIGVSAEGVEVIDVGIDGDEFAVNADGGLLVKEETAEGIFGAEADEDDAGVWVREIAFKVMKDAARLAHAGGGDDDEGAGLGAESAGFFGGDNMQGIEAGERAAGAVGHAKNVWVACEGAGGLDGERAVNIDGRLRQFTGIDQSAQLIDDALGAADGIGGDDDDAACGEGGADVAGKVAARVGVRAVFAMPVGAFKDGEFGAGRDGGIRHDPVVVAADITGIGQHAVAARSMFTEDDGTGAGDMAGREEEGVQMGAESDVLAPCNRVHQGKGLADVVIAVEIGQGREAAFEAALVELGSLGAQDKGAVGEEQGAEINGGGGGVDGAAEAEVDEAREAAAVIHVSMREENAAD